MSKLSLNLSAPFSASKPDPAAAFARREKLRLIMRQAWSWARHGAQKFGGKPIQYLAEALRIVWAEKKKLAREIAESRARVLAEVAKMQAEGVIAPPRPVARYRTPPPGLRSFTRVARHGALGPVTVRV
jgi:Streptococcus thermophilus bacteriophage Gp111 protein